MDRRLLGNTLWRLLPYGVSMTLSLTVGVLMARYLGPDRLGALASALALTGFLTPIASLCLDLPTMRELQGGRKAPRTILGTVATLQSISSVTVFLVALLLGRLGFVGNVEGPVILFTATALLSTPLLCGTSFFESKLNPRLPLISQTITTILAAAGRVVVIVCHGSLSLLALTYALEPALRGAMVTTGFLSATRPSEGRRWDGVFAKIALKDGGPLLATTLTSTLYMRIGQSMTSALAGAHEAGLLAAAWRLVAVPMALATILASTYGPKLLQCHNRKGTDDGAIAPEYDKTLDGYSRWNALALLGWTGGLALIAPPLVALLFGAKYAGSAALLRWLSLWVALYYMGAVLNTHFGATRQLRFQFFCWLLCLVLHVALNFYWIPRYGAMGCTLSLIFAQGFGMLGLPMLSVRNRRAARLQITSVFHPWPRMGE